MRLSPPGARSLAACACNLAADVVAMALSYSACISSLIVASEKPRLTPLELAEVALREGCGSAAPIVGAAGARAENQIIGDNILSRKCLLLRLGPPERSCDVLRLPIA